MFQREFTLGGQLLNLPLLLLRWVLGWWHILYFGALAVVVACTFSVYKHWPNVGKELVRQIYLSLNQHMTAYILLAGLVSLVLSKIVIVTAQSYGLSYYALEMVVRTLVLELLPLIACLYVALRYVSPMTQQVRQMQQDNQLVGWESAKYPMAFILMPRFFAAFIACLALVMVGSIVSMSIVYVVAYGFNPWGFELYTRLINRVFSIQIIIEFVVKTLLFGLAVAVIPLACNVRVGTRQQQLWIRHKRANQIWNKTLNVLDLDAAHYQQGAIRLLIAVCLIEIISLLLRYF